MGGRDRSRRLRRGRHARGEARARAAGPRRRHAMTPRITLLEPPLLERILAEAMTLLATQGARVQDESARALLAGAGASVDAAATRIPEALLRAALASVPRRFHLYDRAGKPAVEYGGGRAHFDPGSSCVSVLDPATLEHRKARAADLVRLVQVTERLEAYEAQSTALVCDDVPTAIADVYRLFLVLWYSAKPVVTGAFTGASTRLMVELLEAECGGAEALRARPRAVFDVCPVPPLLWSEFACESLKILARAGVPAEIVSVPLAGATAPVTLAGALVQHTAECLAGLAIHQLAAPGAPLVWGGAPAIFDMRTGTAPMGAIETAMLDCAAAQVGRHLGLPTHGYLCGSDAKSVDAQAGLETGMAALLGVLGGINMISGAGMLDTLACHSVEKLVLDAEAILAAQRLGRGIEPRGDSLALAMFARTGLAGDFLKLTETRDLFRKEQVLPSAVIDRGALGAWRQSGRPDAFARARSRVDALLAQYRRPPLEAAREGAMLALMRRLAAEAGLAGLPGVD
ncbi:MAG: trimethylamine methyltransferase family protein [Steroidobacteraceae bacterium]